VYVAAIDADCARINAFGGEHMAVRRIFSGTDLENAAANRVRVAACFCCSRPFPKVHGV
jgi:hypothetical protein